MRDDICPECGSPNLQRYEDGAVEWKIFFSPEFSGHVFTSSEIMMDTVVTNTIGLVNLLELRLGLHYDEVSAQERMALYYDAVSKYMEAYPKNVMAESFKTSGLTTAKAMLGWRDELRSADWDFDGASISSRLSVLIGVEEYFKKKDGCDMAGRLHIVTDQVAMQKLDCSQMTCLLACDKDWLKPNVRELLNALERQGAKLELIPQAPVSDSNLCRVREMIFKGRQGKITLDENDSSLLIYQFNDERQAAQYLAYEQMDDVDLWINADNKQMDNWLLLMNKAMTGSITSDCTPQLTQLFVMGLGLFASPLNVNTLIEWLNMPLHPLDSFFRSLLAEAIVKEGGYRNDVCRNLVKDYVDGKFVYLDEQQKALSIEEQQEIREKGREQRQKKVDAFLPPLQASDEIETEKVRLFVSLLASWSRQRAHLMDDGKQNLQWIEQLTSVAGMCDALHILLSTISSPVIDYQTIDSWMSGIYEKGSFTNAVAEKGCRMVVDSPSKIASVAQNTVWMGVDGDDAMAGECAFLYPSEKLQLTQERYIRAWDESMQNQYHQFMSLTPLRMTEKQLVLVVCLSRAGEATLKHPLMVRLEQQVSNLDKFIRTPKIDEAKFLDVKVVDREEAAAEIKFDHASKLQWPDHLSPTSIATLTEYPLDFLMERMLNITAEGKAQMADVKTIQGNVAHAVIEALFAPRQGKTYATPKEIAERLKEYDAVYNELVEAKGAILQLAENKLTEKLLHEQLRSCLDSLLEILKDNELKVTGCERYVEMDMKLGLPKTLDENGNPKASDMLGFIDMTLEDRDGHPVVFDFKWTTWAKGYQNKLEQNRSVQLELYRQMLEQTKKDEVKRVAYFLMPEARLYSKEAFKGRYCTQIESSDDSNIVEQLRQGVIYRKKQLDAGLLEMMGPYDELSYVNDTEDMGLYPLLKDDKTGGKKANSFSQYGLFLTKMQDL